MAEQLGGISDSDWVMSAFMVRKQDIDVIPSNMRTFSSAKVKFTDTTPGGNLCINPLPQASRYADPAPSEENSVRIGGRGMGEYYSEAIDDNSRVIHMRFGVPSFNSLSNYLVSVYSTGAGRLARTGRALAPFYEIGRVIGTAVQVIAWPLMALNLVGKAAQFFIGRPSSAFYFMKPTMPLYWNAVQTLVNHISVNAGIVLRETPADAPRTADGDLSPDQRVRERLHQSLGDIFTDESGHIDVFALANKAQRMALRQRELVKQINDSAHGNSNVGKTLTDMYMKRFSVSGNPSFSSYMDKWFQASAANPTTTTISDMETSEAETYTDAKFMDFLNAEWNEGGAFASFRVDHSETISETFSNSFKENDLGAKVNEKSKSARDAFMNMAGFNLSDNPLMEAVEGVAGAAKDVIQGGLDKLGLGGLNIFAGSAFAEFPKYWESASAQLPAMSYTMTLTSPYGNPISRLVNIIIPLAMILASVLPRKTGKQSHIDPFLCELYDKGYCQTRLGMVRSLTVTRGDGVNVGWNNRRQMLSLTVSFEVEDLSTVMAMPISEGFNATEVVMTTAAGAALLGAPGAAAAGAVSTLGEAMKGVFDDDNIFNDYMAVLGGLGMLEQIYSWTKFKRRLAINKENMKGLSSPARWASFANETAPSKIVSAFMFGSARN